MTATGNRFMKPMTMRERLALIPQRGTLAWIGVRPAYQAPMVELDEVEAMAGFGLSGDRTAAGTGGGRRQVSLVQGEHLPVIATLSGVPAVRPSQLRRNLVITGINLVALNGLRIAIGDDVILVGTGPCAPCNKMEVLVGPGAFQAMRGHGGLTARVERGGLLRRGDVVRALGVADADGTKAS
jgi:MOSC domain-containing protein YiiM